ncbi:hypothetical protein IWQ56_004382 [Coemansia nantahalensis]|nr:hypothetical protein IWQ56_004382 [Coemansia nantahalensis]
MVRLIDEDHREYTPLRTADLESAEFLESIAQGLSTFKDTLKMPTVSDELDRAMAAFEEGVRYIYKEGEFEDRDDPLALAAGGDDAAKSMAIDREGWAPGVLETVLWKRRQERAQRRREQQRGDDTSDLSSSGGSSSDSDDGSGSSSSGSPSSSEYDGGGGARKRHAAAAAAKPTSINRALGSDNLGFKLLAKLGWQEGQGLGAAGDGIVEPIRLQTRFSTVRQGRPGSAPRRGKGKRVVRPSLGVGRTGDERVPEITDDHLEQFRRQKSHAAASHLQGDDIDGG